MSLSCGCNTHYAQLESLITPKARKEYQCEECGCSICKGEVYVKYKTLYDGSWNETKVCEPCYDLGESMAELGFCWILGGLKEAHQEYIAEYAPPKLTAKGIER